MVKGRINCGICGHTVEVNAIPEGRRKVKLDIKSSCGNYQKIAEELKEAEPFKELFQPLGQGEMFQLLAKNIPHPSCPGIAGILKTIEVAAGLALPQTAVIEVEKVEG
jgi:hypothetical protein